MNGTAVAAATPDSRGIKNFSSEEELSILEDSRSAVAPEMNGAQYHYDSTSSCERSVELGPDTAKSGDITIPSDTRMLVSADGTQIYANAVGDPGKQAIVFIHGFCWSLMAFDDIFNDSQWTSRLYLVRYDVRGHGRSGKPDNDEAWESKRLAEDFDAVVHAFKLQRPFVAGWSLGATHLMDILSFHPIGYVAGIVNIAGGIYIFEDMLERLGSPFVITLIQTMLLGSTVEEYQEAAIEFFNGCCRTLPYEVLQMCLGGVMTQSRSMMMRSIRTRKQDPGTFDVVGRTTIPCLVIYGERDELVLVDRLPGCYKDWKNVTTEVVEGGSHVPWSKTDKRVAELFSEKMLRWIDRVMTSSDFQGMNR